MGTWTLIILETTSYNKMDLLLFQWKKKEKKVTVSYLSSIEQ